MTCSPKFWKPLFDELRQKDPTVRLIGEQANWSDYGEAYFTEADIDYMFAFNRQTGHIVMGKRSFTQST